VQDETWRAITDPTRDVAGGDGRVLLTDRALLAAGTA
jgi:hypothetical protein